jgi:Tfp pilus assembly protein PilF
MASNLQNAPKEFLRLFKAGKNAARAGKHDQAHELFRKAIEIDPYHEQIWLWLASVVETDDDRRVCFENVLELDPANATARRQLNRLETRALEDALQTRMQRRMPDIKPQISEYQQQQQTMYSRYLVATLMLIAVLVMILMAVITLLF